MTSVEKHIETVPFTIDELYTELGWYMAEKLAKELLDKELISMSQYMELIDLNKKSFPIISVDLLPKSLDTTDLQR